VALLHDGCFVAWNVGVSPKSQHFAHARVLTDAGLTFWRQIVWAKAGVAFPVWQTTTRARKARKYHPNYTHEMIFLFTKGDPVPGDGISPDDAYSKDVWHIHQSAATRDIPGESNGRKPRVSRHGGAKKAAHPAAYPVGVPEGCVRHLTSAGETVFDPFSGAGTTLIAAEKSDRRFIGMELSLAYVDVAVKRWQDFTGEQAELEATGEKFPVIKEAVENGNEAIVQAN